MLMPQYTNERIENYKGRKGNIILSRALAPLESLISYSLPLLAKGGYMLFMKGPKLQNEIAEAQKKWHFTYEEV